VRLLYPHKKTPLKGDINTNKEHSMNPIIINGINSIVKFNIIYPLPATKTATKTSLVYRAVDLNDRYLPLNQKKYRHFSDPQNAESVIRLFPDKFPNGGLVQMINYNWQLQRWEYVMTLKQMERKY
jgi:hypothetical protein